MMLESLNTCIQGAIQFKNTGIGTEHVTIK